MKLVDNLINKCIIKGIRMFEFSIKFKVDNSINCMEVRAATCKDAILELEQYFARMNKQIEILSVCIIDTDCLKIVDNFWAIWYYNTIKYYILIS